MSNLHTFIATHKKLEQLPFPHSIICLDGLLLEGAISSKDHLPDFMEKGRAFASYRAGWTALRYLKNQGVCDDDFLAVYSYRSFFGSIFNDDFSLVTTENTTQDLKNPNAFRLFRTHAELDASWRSDLLLKIPDNIDLVITRPVNFSLPFVEQYASSHHLDDLMFGMGIAIRLSCISQEVAAIALSNKLFIHGFVGRISFWQDLYDKLFLIAEEFYKNHYIQRDGYQARSINFVLERIVSIYLIQKVYFEKMACINTNLIQLSEDGGYVRGE